MRYLDRVATLRTKKWADEIDNVMFVDSICIEKRFMCEYIIPCLFSRLSGFK